MTDVTKAELRKIVRESETMATLLARPGELLTGPQRERIVYLLRASARYNRLAFSKAKVRELPEGATR
jgi:hypothetical protein